MTISGLCMDMIAGTPELDSAAIIAAFIVRPEIQDAPFVVLSAALPLSLDRIRHRCAPAENRPGAVRWRRPRPGTHRRTQGPRRTRHQDRCDCRYQHGRGGWRPVRLWLQDR